MLSLPSEILTLIFNYLEIKDLLSCQLISKQWRINSLARVYSHADLCSEEAARLFIQTLSNSPQLGEYLDTIYLGNMIKDGSDEILVDERHLLETIIQHCPNITEIMSFGGDVSFWTIEYCNRVYEDEK